MLMELVTFVISEHKEEQEKDEKQQNEMEHDETQEKEEEYEEEEYNRLKKALEKAKGKCLNHISFYKSFGKEFALLDGV